MASRRPSVPLAILALVTTAVVGGATTSRAELDVEAPGDSTLHARAFIAAQAERAWRARSLPPELRLENYKRAVRCNDDPAVGEPGIDQPCYIPPGVEIAGPPCEDGPALEPLWFQFRTTPEADWSDWEMLVGWSCPEHLLPPVGVEDFRVLDIAPGGGGAAGRRDAREQAGDPLHG